MHLFKFFIIIISSLSIGFGACDRSDKRLEIDLDKVVPEADLKKSKSVKNSIVYFFGFDSRSTPQEDARQYTPFLNYLKAKTGLNFELHFTHGSLKIADELGRGFIHFAALGAGSFLLAEKRYGIIPLVRGLNKKNKAEYQSVIVVLPQSSIKRIKDLKGKRFAFGDRASTQGHLIPRAILYKHKILLKDLATYKFTGSHSKCANEVISRRSDACGMQDTMGKDLAKDGQVRIIYTSMYYPSSGIAANKDVKGAVIKKVIKALLEFQPKGRDAKGLYHWNKTEMPNGFKRTHKGDYAKLMIWAKRINFFKELGK